MPHSHTYADLLRLNAWIRKNSDTWYLHCTTRTVQESKLYPVPAYMTLSYFQAYYRFPELLRKIDAAMPAEEIGDRMREIDSKGDIISHSCVPEFYLAGRRAADRPRHAQAHRRARRPRVRRGLRRAAEPRLPPQPRSRAAVGRQPARPAHPRAPRTGVRGRRDRDQARRPAVDLAQAVHGHRQPVRAALALRVPPRHLQPRPVPLPRERGDAGARLRRPRRGRPAVARRHRRPGSRTTT